MRYRSLSFALNNLIAKYARVPSTLVVHEVLLCPIRRAHSFPSGYHLCLISRPAMDNSKGGDRRPDVPFLGSPASFRSVAEFLESLGKEMSVNAGPSPRFQMRSSSYCYCSFSRGSVTRPASIRAASTTCPFEDCECQAFADRANQEKKGNLLVNDVLIQIWDAVVAHFDMWQEWQRPRVSSAEDARPHCVRTYCQRSLGR